MPEKYFIKFPTIEYSNTFCKNITRRVVVEKKYNTDPSDYHDYTLEKEIRSDYFSERYYDDPYMEWIVYLDNKIIDPYYGWYLTTEEFNNFIVKKYGSIETAQKKIKYYQLNWPIDSNEISKSYYDNNLPSVLKKYYTPNYADNARILSYIRKRDDFIVNTNKIIDISITNTTGNGFIVGEIVDIKTPSLANTIGGGEVVFANTTVVRLKNISGNTAATNKLVGESSNTTSTISTSQILPGSENLNDEEYVYWSPVYYYEYEQEKNELNKNIRVIDKKFSLEISENLRVALK